MKNLSDILKSRIFFITLVGSFFFSFLSPAQVRSISSSLDSLARIHLDKTSGIGFYVGIVQPGEEIMRYYGISKPGTTEEADTNTLFELGPVSGTFTSILFAEMSLTGLIEYDSPLQKYLPFDVHSPVFQNIVCKPVKNSAASYGMSDDPTVKFTPYICKPDTNSRPQPVLLCYLATHTSGLPDRPYTIGSGKAGNSIYRNYSREDLYEFLDSYHLTEPISYNYVHSDLGLAVLGHVLSLHSRTTFDSLLKSRILDRLGMNSTGFSYADKEQLVSAGYDAQGNIMQLRYYDMFAPAGALHAPITDMMRFLSANTGTAPGVLKDVLDYTHNPRILLESSENSDSEIAMGWKLRSLGVNGLKAVYQGGSTEAHSAFIGFEETRKCGVVILSNSNVSVVEPGLRILKMLTME